MKKALIVNHNGVGNGLMTVPLLKVLDISYLRSKYFHIENPLFEIPFLMNKAKLKNLNGMKSSTWRSFPRYKWPEIEKFIRTNKIDTIINLRNEGPVYDRAYFAFKKKHEDKIDFWNLDFDTVLHRAKGVNLVYDLLTMFKSKGCKISSYDQNWLKNYKRNGGEKSQILFYIGASQLSKRWPIQNWVKLARKLCKDHNNISLTLMTGATQEEQHDMSTASTGLIDLCREVPLNFIVSRDLVRIAKIFSEQEIIVSNDTFSIHLASAYNRPNFPVACYGAGVRPQYDG